MIQAEKTILIIDDDPEDVSEIKEILQRSAFKCIEAFSGPEGFSKSKEIKPSLILLDLMLPAISGLGMLRQFKNDPELAKIPILVLTGLCDRDIKEEALDLGALAYLEKESIHQNLQPMVSQYAS